MENYSRSTSFPDSGDLSPPSREVDFENTTPWEEQPPSSNDNKVKFMCSYGGKIIPRPHDNQLTYAGGETKILAVDRNIKYFELAAKIPAICDADVCFKYQLPGEDLDALISVTNDDDLEHMMNEYDRLSRGSSKPARLRLFLFTVNQSETASLGRFGSAEERSEKDKFVDALNSGPAQPSPSPAEVVPPSNAALLFGSGKGMPPPPPPPQHAAAKVQNPIPIQGVQPPISVDQVMDADSVQRQIQNLRIGAQEQAMYRRQNDDNLAGGFNGDYYVQKFPENVLPGTLTSNVPVTVSAPAGYWPERHVSSGVYPTATTPGAEQSVYMIPAPTPAFHTPMGRPVTGPTGQGYFAIPGADMYRDGPPVYNVVPSAAAQLAPSVAPSTLPPQPPQKAAGFSEGFGMVRTAASSGVGVVEAGYAAVAYDGGTGRQAYYNAAAGVVPPQYHQAVGTAVSADIGPPGALNPEGKVVGRVTQGSV